MLFKSPLTTQLAHERQGDVANFLGNAAEHVSTPHERGFRTQSRKLDPCEGVDRIPQCRVSDWL